MFGHGAARLVAVFIEGQPTPFPNPVNSTLLRAEGGLEITFQFEGQNAPETTVKNSGVLQSHNQFQVGLGRVFMTTDDRESGLASGDYDQKMIN